MVRGPRGWLPVLLPVALAAVLALAPGCQMPDRRAVPFRPPLAQPLAPADNPCGGLSAVPPTVALASAPDGCTPYDPAASDACPLRPPRNILALSGGGAYGAYAAGFIGGWTRSGARPEFDVVTGVSTGALIAPLAFLGPEYDDRLGQLYTRIQAADIFRVRAWVSIPFQNSVASSAPLKTLIESEISQELLDRIAAEHRKGRRLYVGTTNLDTRRLVVWDMGAIACRPCPEGCRLFRDVLLASSAVPGMLPPVQFEVEVDGRKATELHADGGITAQVFVPSHVFAAAVRGAAAAAKAGRPVVPADGGAGPCGGEGPNGNLYVVVAGKLYPDAEPVPARVLPVMGATTRAVLYAHCRADLANLYGLARAAGLRYHLTALPPGYQALETSVDFNQKQMARLFQEGRQQGAGGAWMSGPPALSPGDGDFIRTGLKLRTPPTLGE